jgi:ACS family sodium-dependent inorganic phosphate cotransporter
MRLAGENKILPFRRRQRKAPKEAAEPAAQVAVIEPELIPEQPPVLVEAEVVPAEAEAEQESDANWKAVVGLSALLAMICSVDRAAMSVALGPMGEQFMWSDSVKGTISSSFFVGYTLTNFMGGYAATRFNPKTVLIGGAVVWSTFTLLTPAMAGNLPALLATRAAMGVGEGVTFPAISNLFAKWVPKGNLTSSLSIAFSGGPIGIITALVVAPALIENLGWQWVFWICGATGLAWSAYWQPTIPEQPPKAPVATASADKAEVKAESPGAPVKLSDVPWGRFVRTRSLLALLWLHCSHNMGPLICLSWMPTYYAQEFGLDVGHSAALSVLPWGLNVVCTNIAGYYGDKMVGDWGVDKTLTRKLMQGLGSMGPAACLFALAADQGHGHGMVQSVALLSATLALGGFQSAGLGSNHQDIAPRWAGILFGVTNACASIVGIGGIIGTGLLLDATHSWGAVFGMAATVYTAGYIGFALYGSAKQQFD